jgi:pyruvate dehydrogenase E1 component alpha subunit
MREQRDPIDNLRKVILDGRHADEAALKDIDGEVRDLVTEATEFAQNSAEPDPSELYTDVLADG